MLATPIQIGFAIGIILIICNNMCRVGPHGSRGRGGNSRARGVGMPSDGVLPLQKSSNSHDMSAQFSCDFTASPCRTVHDQQPGMAK